MIDHSGCAVCHSADVTLLGTKVSRRQTPPLDLQQAGTNTILDYVLRSDSIETNTHLCRSCRHIYLSPTFDEDELDRFYSAACLVESKRQYRLSEAASGRSWAEQHHIDPARQASLLAGARSYRPRRLRQLVAGSGGMGRIRSVLDFGARTGELTMEFVGCRRFVYDKDLTELSDADVEALTSHAQLKAHSPYDLIVLSHVLEHVPFPTRLLCTLQSLLAPGGGLYVEVPIEYCGALLKRRGIPLGGHVNYFSRRSLARAVELAGFPSIADLRREVAPYGECAMPVLKLIASNGSGRPRPTSPGVWPLDLFMDVMLTVRARKLPPRFA